MIENPGEITITLESEERKFGYEAMGIGYNSSDQEIIDALSPMIEEDVGLDLASEFSNGNWTLKRIDSSQNIYVFPKSTAGMAWGLITYSDALVRQTVKVVITAAENGYVVRLTGSVKEAKRAILNNEYNIEKEFVYDSLSEGIEEITKFFDKLDKSKDIVNTQLKVLVNGNIFKIIELLPDDSKDVDKVAVVALQHVPDKLLTRQYKIEFVESKSINFIFVH